MNYGSNGFVIQIFDRKSLKLSLIKFLLSTFIIRLLNESSIIYSQTKIFEYTLKQLFVLITLIDFEKNMKRFIFLNIFHQVFWVYVQYKSLLKKSLIKSFISRCLLNGLINHAKGIFEENIRIFSSQGLSIKCGIKDFIENFFILESVQKFGIPNKRELAANDEIPFLLNSAGGENGNLGNFIIHRQLLSQYA